MALLTANVYEMRGRTDVSHIQPMPLWAAIIRICQFILAIIVLNLTCYARSVFNYTSPGFGMSFFVFVWTSLLLGHIGFSAVYNPTEYNTWFNIVFEVLAVIFWLITWALLASEASTWGDLENVPLVDNSLPAHWKAAIDCAKASAGLGALEWVLFIITLVFFGTALFRLRPANGGAIAPTPAPITEEHKMNTMPQPVVQDPRYGGQQAV